MDKTDTQDSNMKKTMTYLMLGIGVIFFGLLYLANSIG
jgi:hypothetical protein